MSSSRWIPRSAPFARASLITCFVRCGPMDSATTSPPCFSLSRRASSRAKLSGSFISKPMSVSRIQAPLSVICKGASLAGTCLIQTATFISTSIFERLRRRAPDRVRLLPALENQRGIGAAKAEGVRQGIVKRCFARMVGHVVEIACRVRMRVVNGRRQLLVA